MEGRRGALVESRKREGVGAAARTPLPRAGLGLHLEGLAHHILKALEQCDQQCDQQCVSDKHCSVISSVINSVFQSLQCDQQCDQICVSDKLCSEQLFLSPYPHSPFSWS